MKNKPISFPALLEAFFTKRLMQQKQASPHTVGSYRDTFRLLLKFAERRLGKQPSKLAFEEIDAPLIADFLEHMEKSRNSSPRTRNLRLTAIRSFFRYAAFEAPEHALQIQRILSIPGKRFNRSEVNYLTKPEVEALLAAPDQSTWTGRRIQTHTSSVLRVLKTLRFLVVVDEEQFIVKEESL